MIRTFWPSAKPLTLCRGQNPTVQQMIVKKFIFIFTTHISKIHSYRVHSTVWNYNWLQNQTVSPLISLHMCVCMCTHAHTRARAHTHTHKNETPHFQILMSNPLYFDNILPCKTQWFHTHKAPVPCKVQIKKCTQFSSGFLNPLDVQSIVKKIVFSYSLMPSLCSDKIRNLKYFSHHPCILL